MRIHNFKATLNATVRVAFVLLFGAVAAFGQTSVTNPISPNPLAFGSVALGASGVQSVTVTAGSAGLDAISSANLTFSPLFSLSTTSPGSCLSTTTGAGLPCTINVVFTPAALPLVNGTLTIISATSGGGLTQELTNVAVALTGTGYSPALTTTATPPLSFGIVPVNLTSTFQTVTLGNPGSTNLSIGIAYSSTAFSTTTGGTCGTSLAANGICTINVVFTAMAVGGTSQTLTVTASSGGSPVAVTGSPVALTGTGYEPSASPATLVFAHPAYGSTTSQATVTLTNTSGTPLTFSLNPSPASAYSVVTGGSCLTPIVLSTGSCTVNLLFTLPAGAPDTTVETGTLGITAAYVTTTGSISVPMSPGSSLITLTETDTGTNGTTTYSVVELTAAPTTITLPDGSTIPMWGYSCTELASTTCRSLNPAANGWSPVVITVSAGQDLDIDLTNNLSFAAGTGTNTVPTSLTIVGQVGGGLGDVTQRTTTAPPDHTNAQPVTWPIAGTGPGVPPVGVGTPPLQGPRVQSFSTEVAAGTTARLLWKNPRPGTYLIESGTHPSIQGPMGLYGILVVTTAPTAPAGGTATAGSAYPGVNYDADVPLLFSEIDPVQNNAVQTAVNTAGFSETAVWSGQPGGCGNPSSPVGVINTCYPPAVNYTPLYYAINGVAFNKTNASASLFPTSPTTLAPAVGTTGTVLVRMVNAGLRMHVPSIVGSQTGAATPPANGFSLIAEDGNPLPGLPRVQNEVFMAAGKTYDVMVNGSILTTTGTTPYATALPVYDRELSLSGNAIARDAGMLAYIGINGSTIPTASIPALASAVARADSYSSVVPCATAPCIPLVVSDPGKGVIANDTNVYGVKVLTAPTKGTLTLSANGTFTYVPNAGWSGGDSFVYQANGTGPTATVTLGAATIEAASGITCTSPAYTANTATYLAIKPPGVLAGCKDAAGYPLKVVTSNVTPAAGLTVVADANGGFTASVAAAGAYSFNFQAQNSQGTFSGGSPTACSTTPLPSGSGCATVTLTFPTGSGLTVSVVDGSTKTPITDYRWIIEEDRTFYVDPKCTTNPPPAGCPTAGTIVPTFGTNFHTSYMPLVATGCTGAVACETGQTLLGLSAVCDVGNGVCRTTATQETAVDPSQVHLDSTKRYYISVLPGDAAIPFQTANASPGHGMGGAPIAPGQTAVTVLAQPTPFPPAKLTVFVYEDDFPLNGEQDGGGGIDILSPNEPGLGGFNITIFDDAGGPGDPTGQVNYDMFNQPLSNSLAGTIDPSTGMDACPINKNSRSASDPTSTGITGTIVTCPKYESDGKTLTPLAGQAVVANMMPGRYGVVATPAADRIARGEEWLQTNTLDGQKAHDSFLRIGEPSFFQEFGPTGFHVSIGFANPAIINGRLKSVCNGTNPNITGTNCTNSITGKVTTERMSRTPDERLYSSGSRASFAFTQCYVSVGDPDGIDFAFTKCAADGTFTLSGLPNGDWRVTTFDQWNDQLVDGLSMPARLAGGKQVSMEIAANQWQANFMTRTFLDSNGDGVSQGTEPGLALVKTNVRFRDGSFSNRNNTDLNGFAAFNEEFPLFSWYVIETDVTRYKNTGTHVVYDAGGPADGTPCGSSATPPAAPCGTSAIADHLANTVEQISLPTNLRVPGAVYCDNADCTGFSIANGPSSSASSNCTAAAAGSGVTCTAPTLSTGRIDPPWVLTEAWQGFSGQNSFLEFGKKAYVPGETGGIRGHVIYSSTRPFDDPQFGTQNVWEPLVPGVTINLYQEGTAPDGSTSLTLVDTTQTSSWDNWAQGLRSDGIPNMNCPGQGAASGTNADLFFFSLYNQPQWLDVYNNGVTGARALPYNSQFKCYDGMHNWNQLQPAPYDGMYQFPSVTGLDPATGKPTGTKCSICVPNPDTSDPYRKGLPMLPKGKYVVEVVVPPGFELVKEEDKNILIGDNFIAPVTVQFPGLGSAIYILPDQAQVGSAYNANNAQNPTQSLGRNQTLTSHEGDTPTVDTFWPCVGATRIVPDYISLFPQSHEVAPFAGATRNLCDRKEVTLDDQTSSQAEFFMFTSTHAAAHFTGVITDDFTSEFDPFSPQFGEKFAPADLPVSIKDWAGNEISRVYADHWGSYDGLTYSTWEVNPPNPTGYSPTMMVTCMNDAGPIPDPLHPGQTITDPLYNSAYSQFCYEIPFMPGATQYMDTPVTPTSAFAGAGYNNPDCAYPDATPAIKEVFGDGIGPWVSAPGNTLTITALGDQSVNNYGYSGPSANTLPFSLKKVTRHYGFGTTKGSVSIGGVALTAAQITGWSDTQITVTVPTGVPNCGIQQQAEYGGSIAQCGELIITAGNGRQSIDTVTVTIGGKAPTHVPASGSIQSAIDAASPGDLIIVDPTCNTTTGACTTPGVDISFPSAHNELLLMWKPVRLQGVGAASSVINANTHPAGKLDIWRRQVNCLFGLAINGSPITGTNPFDPTGSFTCGSSNGTAWYKFKPFDGINPQIDRLPLEATVGWDANLNGNLAELLQEPSLMGALEGAGITVLSKGVNFPSNPFDPTLLAGFPVGTKLLTAADCGSNPNPFPSNFWCNPSSIDGLTITNSSQGGGAIFVHGWGHNIQIANNRVQNNSGTLSGGINVGQGEFPPGYLQASATNAPPGSCYGSVSFPGPSVPTNTQLPYCHDLNVNVHHNAIMLNASTGDELFSATPAGAGGISFCTGSDLYKFNHNWVCGNLSTGDGGGVGHLGFTWNGDIESNAILFNQSTNPTIATNGGGILIYGAPDVDPPCGATTDADCLAPANTVAPSDGTGPGLVINANLMMGNAAESGSGGGLRLHNINGSDVINFPTTPSQWYSPRVTNNVIVNNVAGWDGGGISLQDALAVNIINNTIMSNDTTASAGVLFNTFGAPLASSQGPCAGVRNNTGVCTQPWTSSYAQPAGLVSIQNSAVLSANMPALVICPPGHYSGTGLFANINGTCRNYSTPLLYNNVFWQNRAFYIGVGSLGSGTQNQQNVVTLLDGFSVAKPVSQTATGQCPTDSSGYYWEIGMRGDLNRTDHSGGVLAPRFSILTDAADYPGLNNLGSDPAVLSKYCNGSRVPPENGGMGYNVPPGISDATVPNPSFSLTPSATVDEGNNWINITWGPLSMTNPVTGATLGNYAIPDTSPAVNSGTSTAQFGVAPPTTDFFGNPRTPPNDIGAVEPVVTPVRTATVAPASLAFGNWATGTTSTAQTLTVTNTGNQTLTGVTVTFGGGTPQPFSRATGTAGGTCTGTISLAPAARCTIGVVFAPTTATAFTGSNSRTVAVTIATATVTPATVTLTGTGVSMAVTPASLTFTRVVGTTSATQTLTVRNSTGGPRSLTITGLVAAPFSRTGGSCGATLAAATSCTINIVFAAPSTPTTGGTSTRSVTITTNGGFTVANSPVTLTGNAVPRVVSATLTPTSWAPVQTRNCPTPALGCFLDPAQTFTLTNTGNVTLTGIAQGVLAGANVADYSVVRLFSTCGPAGNGQLLGITTLAPGATCAITVQFKPLTAEPAGTKNATISVTDLAGTQTSVLAGQGL